jgi:hypothetical protein
LVEGSGEVLEIVTLIFLIDLEMGTVPVFDDTELPKYDPIFYLRSEAVLAIR